MGMELGIDKKQIEAIKNAFERWTSDRVQLRFLICLFLLALGTFAVINPLAGRLASARSAADKANKLLKKAEELAFWTQQIQSFESRLAVPADIVDWQSYVLEKLSHSSAQLIALQPKSTSSRSVYKVVQMEVVAKGKSYEEFVDFIDQLEHGDRLVRLETVRVEKQQDNISLTCTVMGLVKPSASKAGKSSQDPPAAQVVPNVAPDVAAEPDSLQSPAGPTADEGGEEQARPDGELDDGQAATPDPEAGDESPR